ncbi:MAG: STAS domain-containing protein, partial [bacterium]|nr:STAS domain-containing protein [bacterium]
SSLLQRNWVRVVLNLEQVPHLHYASLQKLVSPLCSLKMASGDLKLAHVNSYHKQLFQVAGVDQHFETYDSLEEAVLSFV